MGSYRRLIGLLGGIALCALFVPDAAFGSSTVVERDRRRIRAHLAEVEAKLRAKDVSHLSTRERRARKRNLDRLREYWRRGEFPHNDIADERTPIFIDGDGRECAVGYLMVESGYEAEAEAIARRENLKRLPNMRSPEVDAWLEQSGLNAKEATMIQPSYSPCSNCDCTYAPVCANDGETYLNECTARKCADAKATNKGCCEIEDEPITPRGTGDGFGKTCPNVGSEDAGSRADATNFSNMCSERSEIPEWEGGSSEGCSSVADRPARSGMFFELFFAWIGLFAIRLRQT